MTNTHETVEYARINILVINKIFSQTLQNYSSVTRSVRGHLRIHPKFKTMY
jgi:hypothetical protein